MGQGQGQEAAARALVAVLLGLAVAFCATAQVPNPLSVLGRVVTTTMDVRTKGEVTADTEIAAGASKRLLDDKGSEWAGVTVLVFAQHVVLAGAVKNDAVKKRVEEVVRRDKNIRSLKNELRTGERNLLGEHALVLDGRTRRSHGRRAVAAGSRCRSAEDPRDRRREEREIASQGARGEVSGAIFSLPHRRIKSFLFLNSESS
jgi:hypothetical protein